MPNVEGYYIEGEKINLSNGCIQIHKLFDIFTIKNRFEANLCISHNLRRGYCKT